MSMSKAVLIFLIFILLLGIFGKLRLPKLPMVKRKNSMEQAIKCKSCGNFLFKNVDCNCNKKKKPKNK